MPCRSSCSGPARGRHALLSGIGFELLSFAVVIVGPSVVAISLAAGSSLRLLPVSRSRPPVIRRLLRVLRRALFRLARGGSHLHTVTKRSKGDQTYQQHRQHQRSAYFPSALSGSLIKLDAHKFSPLRTLSKSFGAVRFVKPSVAIPFRQFAQRYEKGACGHSISQTFRLLRLSGENLSL